MWFDFISSKSVDLPDVLSDALRRQNGAVTSLKAVVEKKLMGAGTSDSREEQMDTRKESVQLRRSVLVVTVYAAQLSESNRDSNNKQW